MDATRSVYNDPDVEYRLHDGAFSVRAKADLVDHVGGVKFYGVWTVAKVKCREELTLDYANGYAHAHDGMKKQHGFACSCTTEILAKARARAKIELGLATKFREANERRIGVLVDAYLERWGVDMAETQAAVLAFAKNNIRVA